MPLKPKLYPQSLIHRPLRGLSQGLGPCTSVVLTSRPSSKILVETSLFDPITLHISYTCKSQEHEDNIKVCHQLEQNPDPLGPQLRQHRECLGSWTWEIVPQVDIRKQKYPGKFFKGKISNELIVLEPGAWPIPEVTSRCRSSCPSQRCPASL